jgi:hypothetical protein
MTPSVDYAEPEPPPMPIIEAVAAPKATGPVDSPWARLNAERTEIETVKPPDELIAPAGPPGIICPACRTENEASRRFCQSCGTPLVMTAPIQEFTAPIKPRSYRWVLFLIPIIIVAGVIGFGGAAIFKGLFGPAASAVASGPPGPTSSGGTASDSLPPSGSTGPVASKLRLFTTSYSKAVPADPTNAHSGGKTIDGKPDTSFMQQCEGREAFVLFTFYGGNVPPVASGGKPRQGNGNVQVATITIRSGDQTSEDIWKTIQRPKKLEITIDGGTPFTKDLEDTFGEQVLTIDEPVNTNIKLAIADVYTDGATEDQCAISELAFFGNTRP